jgi:lysozyme family protein
MPGIRLTQALREEYELLFSTCRVRQDRFVEVDNLVDKLLHNKVRYENVGDPLDIPWAFIAVIHNMESSQRFDRHLHNGDPLTGRTTHVPAGRPSRGTPPFTWEESATDALRFEHLTRWNDWSLAGTLYKLEAYNGWGYRRHHPEVLSPYLWSRSYHYERGKYVADGRWSDTAVSRQTGAAVLLRRMSERGINVFELPPAQPLLRYSHQGELPYGEELQVFLNSFPGVRLRVDGWPGSRTSEAFKAVTGYYLLGDPRNET